ncbi:MAG: response regulator [Cyanobacteria bacterium J06642_11]
MKSTIDALLVEDSCSDAQLVEAIISSSDLVVPQLHRAERFEKALDMMETNKFDVVLLDLHLPDGQGLSLIKRLQQLAPQVPVVVLTSTQDPILAEAALQEGVQDYVVKSETFSPDRLTQLGYVDVGNLLVQRIQYAIKRSESNNNVAIDQERCALVAQGTNDGIWDWDLEENRIYYSPNWRRLLGGPPMGDSPEAWLSRIHPEDRERFEQTLDKYLTRQYSKFHCEYRLRHQNGDYLWVLTRGTAIWNAAGIAYRLVGCQTDMTMRSRPQKVALPTKDLAETALYTVGIGLFDGLAELYLYEGRDSEAEPLLQGVLAMRMWLLGPTHLDVAVSLYKLATLYDNQGRYNKAQPLFQEALDLCEQNLGAEHPSTKMLRSQLQLISKMNQALDF